jgi:hypothetical protein
VYLECSGDGTESRLRQELQRNFPNLPAEVRLSEVVLRMIEGEWLPAGRKLVVVLDQFEQWLYRHGAEARTELGDALAECDGGRVQFVLMIRDDFWSGLERFLQRTDLPVTDDSYRLFVDVFDRQHGERVLTLLGQGAGCLPQRLTTECRQFAAPGRAAVGRCWRHRGLCSVVPACIHAAQAAVDDENSAVAGRLGWFG